MGGVPLHFVLRPRHRLHARAERFEVSYEGLRSLPSSPMVDCIFDTHSGIKAGRGEGTRLLVLNRIFTIVSLTRVIASQWSFSNEKAWYTSGNGSQ